MIVEDPNDVAGADADAVLVLDDWLDSRYPRPDSVLMALNPGDFGRHGRTQQWHRLPGGTLGSRHVRRATVGRAANAVLPEVARWRDDSTHRISTAALIDGSHPTILLSSLRRPVRPFDCESSTQRPKTVPVCSSQSRDDDRRYRWLRRGPIPADTIIVGIAQRYDVLVVESETWPVVAKVEAEMVIQSTVLRSTDALALANPDVAGNLSELAADWPHPEDELRPTNAARLNESRLIATTTSN